ncbi:MAG: hypothetical protein RLZZ91_1312 [Bacteroidota bacterium]|jgi:hypothetical protein
MKKLTLFIALISAFSNSFGQAYFLNGSATATGNDCYQLTPNLGTQNGTVWYADQIDLNQPFDLSFEMFLGNVDVNGADGLCFVMHTQGTAAIGASGGGMGYLNFGTSFAVEFDTYQNSNPYSDPGYDHVAIQRNGNVNHNTIDNLGGPVQMSAFNANTEDGQYHPVRLIWDPINNLFSVYFDCELRLQTTVDIIEDVFSGQGLVNWGFTAGTGGLSNIQSVCLTPDILNTTNDVTICPGAAAVLTVSGADVNGTFQWTPATNLSNPNGPSPVATPSSSTIYNVVYTDLCGVTTEQNFNVTVEPLSVDAIAVSDINCANPVTSINSISNINGVTFFWITSDGSFITPTNAFSVGVDSPGFYSVLTDYQGICQAMDTITIVADYSDFQIITGGSILLNCLNPNGNLSAVVNGFPNTAYNWTTVGGTINGGATSASINVAAAGTYTVNATLNSNCFDTETITVNADFDVPTLNLSCLNGLNCLTPTATINSITNAGTATYNWTGPGIQSGQGTGDIVVNAAGIYSLTVTDNSNGCQSSANNIIAENFTTPTISIGIQDTLSCLNPVIPIQNVSINNTNNYSLAWSTVDGFIVDGTNTIIPNVSVSGDYTLLATDNSSGCTDTQNVFIPESSSSQFAIELVQYPNIVTITDGDLLNACWSPFLSGLDQSELFTLFDTFELDIYNRWGKLIFESSVPTSFCPDEVEFSQGTYFYTLIMSSLCGDVENYQVSGTFLVK